MVFTKKLNQDGFSLVEILLSISLLVLITGAIVGAVIYGQQSAVLSGSRIRAAALAEEGIEATKNIKDQNFLNLSDGDHGLAISSNHWVFSGTEDLTGIFRRKINISSLTDDTKKVVSTVTWDNPFGQNNLVSLTTYMTDWTVPYVPLIDYLDINIAGAKLEKPGYDILVGIILKNTSPDRSFTIAKIKVSWVSIVSKINQNIQALYIGETLVWSQNGPGLPGGSQPSGTLLDIQDYIFTHGLEKSLKLDFTGNMKKNIFTLTFYLPDGSNKTVTGIGPL